MVGAFHGLGLGSLGEIGGEAETALGVLDHGAQLPPSPERLLRRVLRLHPAKPIVHVALHFPSNHTQNEVP